MKSALGQSIRQKPWGRPIYPLVDQVDDRPAGRRLRSERLCKEQRRAQVDREVAIESVPFKMSDFVRLELGGIVDEESQRADRCDGSRHQAKYRIVIGKISRHNTGTPSIASDLAAQRFCCRQRPVGVDRDRISGAGKRENDGAADALGPPGDEGGRLWGRGECRRHVRLIAQMILLRNPGGTAGHDLRHGARAARD